MCETRMHTLLIAMCETRIHTLLIARSCCLLLDVCLMLIAHCLLLAAAGEHGGAQISPGGGGPRGYGCSAGAGGDSQSQDGARCGPGTL